MSDRIEELGLPMDDPSSIKLWISQHAGVSTDEIDRLMPGFCPEGLYGFGMLLIDATVLGLAEVVREAISHYVSESGHYVHPEICGNPKLGASAGVFTRLELGLGLAGTGDVVTHMPENLGDYFHDSHDCLLDPGDDWAQSLGLSMVESVRVGDLAEGASLAFSTASGNRYVLVVEDPASARVTLLARYRRHPYGLIGCIPGAVVIDPESGVIKAGGYPPYIWLPLSVGVQITKPAQVFA